MWQGSKVHLLCKHLLSLRLGLGSLAVLLLQVLLMM